MQVYGSSENLSSFARYGLNILEDARMDYMTALSQVEIFLGEVFSAQASDKGIYQIFDTGIDKCRALYGEKAVKLRINAFLGHELGHMVQKIYLPAASPKWEEMERMLGVKFDFKEYHSRVDGKNYYPAQELAADLFDCALKGCQEIVVTQVIRTGNCYSKELQEEVLIPRQFKKTRVKINPHLWRKWFYGLWGQQYEWGYFIINEKMAMANDHIYFFDLSPKIINKRSHVPARDLLEAHGFKVSFSNNGRVEYWR